MLKTIPKLPKALRQPLLQLFADAGVNLNIAQRRGKQGAEAGYGSADYPICKLVDKNKSDVDLDMIRLYLDCGVNVNCARSSWDVEFGGGGIKSHTKKHMHLFYI